MTDAITNNAEVTGAERKPRLVLMGEFSAGKSTLTNILLDNTPLPMRVTATRLPPVQISYGTPAAFAIGYDGQRTEVDVDKIADVPFDETLMIHVQMESDVLQLCDLVDMPGISDPNMRQDIWENIIEPEDNVIWCTHATQAWRQSEAAIWKLLSQQLERENILLITQFDKLQNDRDKRRVVKRVENETKGLFDAIYPVSLIEALNSEEGSEAWESSGAAALSEHIIRLLMGGEPGLPNMPENIDDFVHNDLRNTAALRKVAETEQHARMNKVPVVPRRVVVKTSSPKQHSVGAEKRQMMQG